MTNERHVPVALSVVAILFLLGGIGGAIDVVRALFRGVIYVNFAILGIPIFFGLRSLVPAWRTCALVFLWIGLVACGLMFVAGLFGIVPVRVDLFGQHFAAPSYWASIIAVPFFCLLTWQ